MQCTLFYHKLKYYIMNLVLIRREIYDSYTNKVGMYMSLQHGFRWDHQKNEFIHLIYEEWNSIRLTF